MPGQRLPCIAAPLSPDRLSPAARLPALAPELSTMAFLEFRGIPSRTCASTSTTWHDFFPDCLPSNPPSLKTSGASLGRQSCGTGCSSLARIERWRSGCTAVRLLLDNPASEFPRNRKDLDNSPSP